MNTTTESKQDSVDTFKANPLGQAIGAALALTATFGILSGYIVARGSTPRYWMTIGIFFIVTTIIGYVIAKARQS